MRELLARSTQVWVLFLFIGVLNGMLAELLYAPLMPPLAVRILRASVMIIAVLAITYVFLQRCESLTKRNLFSISAWWLLLSFILEIGFLRFVLEEEWSSILQRHNIFEGRIWALSLFMQWTAPLLLGPRIRRKRERIQDTPPVAT